MNVEALIYIYMAVCVSMILFNFIVMIRNRRKKKQFAKKDRIIYPRICEQISRINAGMTVDEKHIVWMTKKLAHIGNLMAFDEAFFPIYQTNHDTAVKYLRSIYPGFISLTIHYCQRDITEATYYVYLVRKYRISQRSNLDFVAHAMMKLVTMPSVYCRENALHTIYQLGDANSTVKALLILDKSGFFHSSKLIHDGLLEFDGSHKELADEIWRKFDLFSPYMQVALIDFMRLSYEKCFERIYDTMVLPEQDDEVRFACIRYFGKFAYEPAYEKLTGYLENKDCLRWEYPAIAAKALSNYKNDRTIGLLMSALNNANWYVRTNAADSLVKCGVTYEDAAKVFKGNDRYAKEILKYWIDYYSEKGETATV